MYMCVFVMQVFDSDASKSKGQFEDVSQVEKYEMSESDYSKRGGKYRLFIIFLVMNY